MNPPPIIRMPLSCFENMRMELAWIFQDLFEQVWEICKDLDDLKESLWLGYSPPFLSWLDYYHLTDLFLTLALNMIYPAKRKTVPGHSNTPTFLHPNPIYFRHSPFFETLSTVNMPSPIEFWKTPCPFSTNTRTIVKHNNYDTHMRTDGRIARLWEEQIGSKIMPAHLHTTTPCDSSDLKSGILDG